MSLKKSKEVKKDSDDNSFNNLKSGSIKNMMEHLFEKQSLMDFVMDTDIYEYVIAKVTTIDDQLVYIINFEPRKRSAKFEELSMWLTMTHYIQLDYSYGEGKVGEKMNLKLLLGVKYVENVNKGTVIYKKNNEDNTYYPYYINHESGQYVYAHRPFKFTENDEESKNKVAFDITIEGNVVEKYELMSLGLQDFG
ncbi:MAG: hypothetical protein R2783_01515 [Gelidibacter sp.]